MHWSRKGKVLLRICGKRADGEGKHGARRVVVVSVRVSQRVVVVVGAEQGSHRLTVGCALFVPAHNAHGDLRLRVAELKGRSGGRGPETGHGSAAKQEQAAKAVQAHTRATWGGATTSSRGSWPSWRIYLGASVVGWSGVVRCGGLHCVRNFCQVVSVGREGRVAPVRSGGGL